MYLTENGLGVDLFVHLNVICDKWTYSGKQQGGYHCHQLASVRTINTTQKDDTSDNLASQVARDVRHSRAWREPAMESSDV